ncbi:MAG: Ig-like domain-containing protein, partial [Gammaproteobacteria bacterium]|nr:Ig-like domain-containing protein [Gammaproteobacteria bacterium]
AQTSLALAALLLGACAREEPTAPVAVELVPSEVVVVPGELVIVAGGNAQLAAQSNDGAGNPIGGAPLDFSSDTPSVLRVSSTGLVASVGPAGQGIIKVASGGTRARVTVTVKPAPASRMEVAGTSGADGVVGEPLAAAIRVKVTDQFRNPVAGIVVQFETEALGGAVAPPQATTDASGVARTAWTLGEPAGAQTLKASAAGVPALEIGAMAVPGKPAGIEAVGTPAAVVAGTPVRLGVLVRDRFRNPVPGVSVAWTVTQGEPRLALPATETNAAGVAEVEAITAGRAETATIVAALPGAGQPSVGLTLESVAGPPARLGIADGDAQDAPLDSAVALRPTVLVTDVNGNPVAGALVTFAVTAGGGRVEEAVQATGSDGRAAPAAWILGAAAENQLQASTPGVNEAVTFTARSRAP